MRPLQSASISQNWPSLFGSGVIGGHLGVRGSRSRLQSSINRKRRWRALGAKIIESRRPADLLITRGTLDSFERRGAVPVVAIAAHLKSPKHKTPKTPKETTEKKPRSFQGLDAVSRGASV